jgi:hypothetical protein
VQLGRAFERHDAGPSQRERGSENCAHVARVLHAIEHERNRPRAGGKIGETPARRLDRRDDSLGMLGVGQLHQLPIAHFHERHARVLERRLERLATGGTFEGWGYGGAAELDAGRQRLLDQPDALGEGEAAPLTPPAETKIPDQRR